MTEEEALTRAREACAARSEGFDCRTEAQRYRSGEYDHSIEVACAKAALLNAGAVLLVDRDLADLREIIAKFMEPEGEDAAVLAGELWDNEVRSILPTFRTIIQRRIEEAK